MVLPHQANHSLDCKTVGFFLKITKEIGKAWRKSVTRANRASLTRPLFSASFHTFCLTARAYLNTQKYSGELRNGSSLQTGFYDLTSFFPVSSLILLLDRCV